MRELFDEHAPSVVFHAAAYKHVPLMEENPVEAVRNNAVATRIVAAAAGEAGVERFVLVSTDKAVSPATVMGASKALAEWAVEAAQNRWKEHALRVGALRQRARLVGLGGADLPPPDRAGGPVTVTDAKMTRYFMTIPEAVQLIIRSGELATGGEVFVLEMGDPVKIVDLAAQHDPPGGLRARRGHRDRDRRAAAGREDPRGAVQPRRAAAAHARREDRLRGAAAARPGVGRERLRPHRGARVRGDAAALAGAVAELSAERALVAAATGLGRQRAARRAAFYSSTLPEIVQEIGAYAGLAAVRGAGGALGALLLAGPRRQAAARVGRTRARARGAGPASGARWPQPQREPARPGPATAPRSPPCRRAPRSPGQRPPAAAAGARRPQASRPPPRRAAPSRQRRRPRRVWRAGRSASGHDRPPRPGRLPPRRRPRREAAARRPAPAGEPEPTHPGAERPPRAGRAHARGPARAGPPPPPPRQARPQARGHRPRQPTGDPAAAGRAALVPAPRWPTRATWCWRSPACSSSARAAAFGVTQLSSEDGGETPAPRSRRAAHRAAAELGDDEERRTTAQEAGAGDRPRQRDRGRAQRHHGARPRRPRSATRSSAAGFQRRHHRQLRRPAARRVGGPVRARPRARGRGGGHAGSASASASRSTPRARGWPATPP